LAPVILIFTLLMNITIGLLMIVMKMRGLEANLVVSGVMIALAIVNAALFYKIWMGRTKTESITYAI
ncbi:MAG TPA: hypothetical protein VJ508_03805, partial [Saprospiraceae bacterium]|nr:hypothetical protein [Saprospiraceae bacterium]